ncbi:Glutaredoxin [Pseudoduganella namucuonensis]|uniref:Glutaredoxin n=2 Tax=Pseudoduganella namucuonensis TaxID=1035707 RepID=A0A1I7FHQ7_9BURK|nr:Glutaredoxin [Pseudoduganella namucuonensis]
MALLLLLCGGMASAQIYKWTDQKGVTHFSDTPPPAKAAPAGKPVEVKHYDTGPATPALPAELATVAKASPVTLYTTQECDICNAARAMLQKRGVPYTEKTVQNSDDMAALRRAGSAGRLPYLLIGRERQTGFEQVTWDEALTAAGYPAQSLLPANYRQTPPAPAAPPPARTAETTQSGKPENQAPRTQRLPPVNASPDFQF